MKAGKGQQQQQSDLTRQLVSGFDGFNQVRNTLDEGQALALVVSLLPKRSRRQMLCAAARYMAEYAHAAGTMRGVAGFRHEGKGSLCVGCS